MTQEKTDRPVGDSEGLGGLADREIALVIERISDAFVALDTEWRYTYVNERAAQMFGRTREDLIGKHIWTEFPEGIDQPFYKAYYRAVETQQPSQIEEYYPPYDRWFENRIYPSDDGLSIFFQDVTERKRAERDLRQAKDYAERLIETANIIVVGLGADGAVRTLNEAAERITGYTKADLEGRSWFEALVPKDRYPHVWEEFGRLTADGAMPGIFENPILTKSGQERLIAWRNSPLDEGEAGVGTVSFGVDVTELRRAEESLNALINAGPEARLLFEPPSGSVRDANVQAERLYGRPRAELLTCALRDLTPPEEHPGLQVALEPVGKGGTHEVRIETSQIRREDSGDQTRFPAEISAARVDIGGRPVVVATVRDVSDRVADQVKIRNLLRTYTVLSDVNQTIVRERDPLRLFEEVCRIAVEGGGFRMAWVGMLDAGTGIVRPLSSAGHVDGYLDTLSIDISDHAHGRGPTATAVRERRSVVCNDIEHDPAMAPWRDEALRRGYRASAAYPVTVHGESWGSFNLYAEEPGFFDEPEMALLGELALDLSFALEAHREEERRLAVEDDLKRNEAQLRRAEEIAHVGSWSSDLATNGITWSPELYRVYGVSPDSFVPTPESFLGLLHPDDRLPMQEWLRSCKAGEEPPAIEHRAVQSDGTMRVLLGRGSLERDEGNQPVRITGTAQDVTALRGIEQSLMESETRFRTVFEKMIIGQVLTAPDGRLLTLNEAFAEMLGYSVEDLLEVPFAALTHPDDLEVSGEAVRALLAGDDDRRRFEKRYLHRDGHAVWVDVATFLLRDAEGTPLHFITSVEDTSERKAAKEALETSEARLRLTLDVTGIGLWDWDMRSDVWYSTPTYFEMLGYDPTEAEQNREVWGERTHPDDRDFVVGKMVEVRDGGEQGFDIEFRFRHADGSYRWIRSIGRGVEFDEEGKTARMLGLQIDVTERREADQALRESRAQLLETQRIAKIGGWEFDPASGEGSWTEEVARIHDVEPGSSTNVQMGLEVYEGEHRRVMERAVSRAVETGDPYDVEVEMVTVKGNRKWVRSIGRPVVHEGRVVRVVGAFQDISERKRREQEISRRSAELAALNAFGQAMNRSLSLDAVVTAAIDETLRAVRPDAAFLFIRDGDGLTLAGIGPRRAREMTESMPAHQVGDCLCGLAVTRGEPLFSRDIHADARCTWEECKLAGLRSFAALPLGSGAGVIGVLGIASEAARDFEIQAEFLGTLAAHIATSVRNAQLYREVQAHAEVLEQRVRDRTSELVLAKERAEEADRVKSAFLATVSHELRTPLNSVIGFTGILLQELPGSLNAEQRKQLGMVQGSARHLLALINDVLDISKIEAGQIEISVSRFRVATSVELAVASVERSAAEDGLALTLHVDGDPGEVVGDRRRFEQVLLNLLSNAVKFTHEGSVEVSVRRVGDMVETEVRDTGIGIREDERVHLFEPFRQIDSSSTRKYEGTGLGLSISKRLVELMGGRMWMDSVPGEGSVFGFAVPVAGAPSAATGVDRRDERSASKAEGDSL